jgi:hypothetical protein
MKFLELKLMLLQELSRKLTENSPEKNIPTKIQITLKQSTSSFKLPRLTPS